MGRGGVGPAGGGLVRAEEERELGLERLEGSLAARPRPRGAPRRDLHVGHGVDDTRPRRAAGDEAVDRGAPLRRQVREPRETLVGRHPRRRRRGAAQERGRAAPARAGSGCESSPKTIWLRVSRPSCARPYTRSKGMALSGSEAPSSICEAVSRPRAGAQTRSASTGELRPRHACERHRRGVAAPRARVVAPRVRHEARPRRDRPVPGREAAEVQVAAAGKCALSTSAGPEPPSTSHGGVHLTGGGRAGWAGAEPGRSVAKGGCRRGGM